MLRNELRPNILIIINQLTYKTPTFLESQMGTLIFEIYSLFVRIKENKNTFYFAKFEFGFLKLI